MLQHCERLVVEAELWQHAHDSAQDALSTMSSKYFFLFCCTFIAGPGSDCLPCFADRRQAVEKQAEKAERTVSTLEAALASKEQELHKQHEELVRLG